MIGVRREEEMAAKGEYSVTQFSGESVGMGQFREVVGERPVGTCGECATLRD